MLFIKMLSVLTILLFPFFLIAQKQVSFTEVLIDSAASGDDKAIADIDNDGRNDLILGGKKFSWYREDNGHYIKYNIVDPIEEFTTDMRTADMDNDGDIDLIVGDGKDSSNVMWYENPLPEASPLRNGTWKKHVIGTSGDWMHNLAMGDVNMDNLPDVVTSGHGITRLWLNQGSDSWQRIDLSAYGGGSVDVYDMDGDGDLDILTTKGWIECPGNAFEQEWIFHPIKGLVAQTVVAGDIDNDGKADILAGDSAHTEGKLFLFKMVHSPVDSVWRKTLLTTKGGSHKLQIADFNKDGYPDILIGLELQYLGILYQQPGNPLSFTRQVISSKGGHNAMAGDIDNDGDLDIISCDYLNHPPLKLFINNASSAKAGRDNRMTIHRWHYNPITSSHMRTFGLAFGDVTGDNKTDIISGSYFYENPSSSDNTNWKQYLIHKDLHAVAVVDVNRDKKDDIIAVDGEINVYWCEGSKDRWTVRQLGKLPKASHSIGAQGHITGQIIPAGSPEIIMTAGGGTYAFKIPDDPSKSWPMIHVTSNTSDEAVAIADFNNDGLNDIAGTFGDKHEIYWFQNPGQFKDDWQKHLVGKTNNKNYLDRICAADFNGDKRADIVVSEENQGSPATTSVFLQTSNATQTLWLKHALVNQYTTNSMDVADLDNDGDIDIVTGEHRGEKKLTIWENQGKGIFRPFIIDRGKESHNGAKLVDLDHDGDLDIVSIAYDKYAVIHVWWNDAITK